ncbi:MAG TPA: pyridoxal phosphate-dependent aminotransferase [Candidatus Omnitrophota bacterium]|jgi:aspartate aminotransferase|nr:MAG: Aspartate aminotransferase [Candidatus Omnitrophica bacterium ADurb.Bin314]HOE68240.1 pyridoxal phosphate-dependent aminotransferase [Candidatus Omnitrophota bacterium]HQB94103.1 pyridoxal phosphate-dependent aminotransferase [Candidatus Omnitrophota bacterium]
MDLSQKVLAVKPSATLAIAAKAREMKARGIDVISLSAGEPDFDTPGFIKEAAIDALRKGQTKYTPVAGTLELREAICRKLKRDQGLDFTPDRIVVGTGAKHAIFNVLFALLNPGDEVLIPSPYWLSYPEMVTVLGGTNVFLPTSEATDLKITPAMLEKAITPKSRVLILNSPSNPTGRVYSKEELLALAAVLKKHPQVLVLSDEIYEKLVFDGQKHWSIAQLDPEVAKRTIIVNGHSKAYAMTGWRLGYAACPDKTLAKAVESIQSHSTSNPVSFAQAGGAVALDKGDEEAGKMKAVFEKRRDLFLDLLSKIDCFKATKPGGAFYIFVNIKKTGLSAFEVARRLLDEAHVAVVPGEPFGSPEHIRLSCACSEKDIRTAVDRMAAWVRKPGAPA